MSPTEGATRLDKLFQLLEGGANNFVRQTAAQQIGDLQKLYPSTLWVMLQKTWPLLFASQWDTRVAAGTALRLIIKSACASLHRGSESERKVEMAFRTGFSELNLKLVVDQGAELYSTNRRDELEVTGTLQERLASQRKMLREKLGLEIATDYEEELISTEDIVMNDTAEDGKGTQKATEAVSLVARRSLRARSSEQQLEVPSESPEDVLSASLWPFSFLADQLSQLLFDGSWETRHGAAIGLRELLSVTSKQHTIRISPEALEDYGVYLACVVVLERFGDYSHDQVVAPVKETASQALSMILRSLDENSVLSFAMCLLALAQHKEWQVRHSVFMGIKYAIASRGDNAGPLFDKVKDSVLQCLEDKNESDDVKAIAAEAIAPAISSVMGKEGGSSLHSFIQRLLPIVFRLLEQADELSSHASALLSFLRDVAKADVLVDTAVVTTQDLASIVPFLFHPSSSIRRGATDAVASIAERTVRLGPKGNELVEQGYDALVEVLFMSLVCESDEDNAAAIENAIASFVLTLSESSLMRQPLRWIAPAITHATSDVETFSNESIASALKRVGKRTMDDEKVSYFQSFGRLVDSIFIAIRAAIPNITKSGTVICALGRAFIHAKLQNDLLSLCTSGIRSNSLTTRTLTCQLIMRVEELQSGYLIDVGNALEAALGDCVACPTEVSTEGSLWKRQAEDLSTCLKACSSLDTTGWGGEEDREELEEHLTALSEYSGSSNPSEYLEASTHLLECIPEGQHYDDIRKALIAAVGATARLEEAAEPLRQKSQTALAAALCTVASKGNRRLPAKISPVVKPLLDGSKSAESEVDKWMCSVGLGACLHCLSREGASRKAGKDKVLLKLIENFHSSDDVVASAKQVSLDTLSYFAKASGLDIVLQPTGDPLCDRINEALNSVSLGLAEDKTKATSEGFSIIQVLVPALFEVAPVDDVMAILLPLLHCSVLLPDSMLEELLEVIRSIMKSSSEETLHAILAASIDEIVVTLDSCDDADILYVHSRSLTALIESGDLKVLPFIPLVLFPVMKRMSDDDPRVRKTCSSLFGVLMRLLPIEPSAADPKCFTQEMKERRKKGRERVEALLKGCDSSKAIVPDCIRAELRDYQKEGIAWLQFLHSFHLHGILCDDMGLGKTLQAITVIASVQFKKALPSIVVCPATLVMHWVQELKKFCPDVLHPVPCYGSRSMRADIIAKVLSGDSANVVFITAFESVRTDINDLKAQRWAVAVIDEGHCLQNPKSKITVAVKALRASFRVMMTGTPIQNSVVDLWSLFDFLMPGYLGDESNFQRRFGKPIKQSRDAKASEDAQRQGTIALDSLHKQVLPFILRRTKESVLKELPPKIIQDFPCSLSLAQADLYEMAEAGELEDLEGSGREAAESLPHVFKTMHAMRLVCSNPSQILARKPALRKHLGKKLGAAAEDDYEINSKFQALEEILLSMGIGLAADASATSMETGHRALVFAQHTSTLDTIEALLTKKLPAVSFDRLDGRVAAEKRVEVAEHFNNDCTVDVLLLTTRVGGLGLNLTGADTVIFYDHDWNPTKDLQAMDRAHRLGQRRTVNVYRLIASGTIEEQIMSLQNFKRDVAQTVVSVENASSSSLATHKLMDLLEDATQEQIRKTKKTEASEEKAVAQELGVSKRVASLLQSLDDLSKQDQQYKEEFDITAFAQRLKEE